MLQTLQTKTISLLDTLVQKLETYDDVSKRSPYFANKCIHHNHPEGEDNKEPIHEPVQDEDDVQDDKEVELAPIEKFKHLSFELIDIGIHEGQKSLNYIKQSPIYTSTDKYIKYEEKIEFAKATTIKAYTFFNDKVYSPLKENFYVIYD